MGNPPQGHNVQGDTHAAQLNGAYTPESHNYVPSSDNHSAALAGAYNPSSHSYTPSSDTHALTGAYTPESHSYTPSSDTHALGGSLAGGSAQTGQTGAGSAGNFYGVNMTLNSGATIDMTNATVTTTVNTKMVVIAVAYCNGGGIGGTIKVFRGTNTGALIYSVTHSGQLIPTVAIGYDTAPGTANQLYTVSFVPSSTGTTSNHCELMLQAINDTHALIGSYSASSDLYTPSSDTHALGGSYTASTDSYTPSSDTHAAQLNGAYTPESHSYTPSSDTHAAALTGQKGSCS